MSGRPIMPKIDSLKIALYGRGHIENFQQRKGPILSCQREPRGAHFLPY